jgi:hypothetical protein
MFITASEAITRAIASDKIQGYNGFKPIIALNIS